ncbi:MAG TPA: trimeric intracellular cation channel family protein [Candidatus Angelobacter sp.]|nr:trimeric intracellular cation channel family protein [Candidatus Angelobacter sp.]
MHTLNLALDLAGTFVFALSGATAAVQHKLDLFGIFVLSYVAGNTGGITRDVLIGAVPPLAIHDWRYVAVSMLAGLITFFRYSLINHLRSPVLIFDAMGLALFAVTGANKALAFHVSPVAVVLLGMSTGIGGGMARDMLVAEIPIVLRADLYAVAALIGATVVVVGHKLNFSSGVAGLTGACLCFGLRFLAIRRHWHLPNAGTPEQSATHAPKHAGKERLR